MTATRQSTAFPLTKFHEWLAKQPEEREFDYCDNCGCLFASFAKEALGMVGVYVVPGELFQNVQNEARLEDPIVIPNELESAANRTSYLDSDAHFTIDQFRKQLEATHVV